MEARLATGRVSLTRGGRELARRRHHLEVAGLSEAQWRERWEAERLFISADGEADSTSATRPSAGNPEEQWLELKLPARLGFLANRPRESYRLDCPGHLPPPRLRGRRPGHSCGDPLRHQLPARAAALVPGRLLATAGYSRHALDMAPSLLSERT
ncbi:MAG TPA: hypothetical protein VKF14_17235 [Candidatus Dormibacteraeota bacterium]|nr:hypothetical protein [Candidatus Dormibacteraeota bacterium]